MMRIAAIALLLLAGCRETTDPADIQTDFYTDLPMQVFMDGVMQHAAEEVWENTGYMMDDAGFRSMFPQDDEEWHDAKVASQQLAELTNSLLLSGRRVDEPDWDEAVVKVRHSAITAATAADAQDEEQFMAAALAIDEGCAACHEVYQPGF